jgi:two-component system cell cycle response regulator DivK
MATVTTEPRLKLKPIPARGPRLLIVEDDPDHRWVLCALMKRMGYDCQVAKNGQEALELVEAFEPQMILMDLRMPVLDGLETTRRLKADARTRDIPVLVISGDATAPEIAAALRAGCEEVMAKPVVLPDLLERLNRHLDH